MQAENSTKSYTSRYTDEDETFWKNHLSNFSASGVTRKNYCERNGVDYHRFTYWMTKLSTERAKVVSEKLKNEASKKLLPVQLKPETKMCEEEVPLSLELKNGYILDIHNALGLSIVLEKLV